MLINKVKCVLCGKEYKSITHTHTMKEHGMSLREYMEQFPDEPIHMEQVAGRVEEGRNLLLDSLQRNWNR